MQKKTKKPAVVTVESLNKPIAKKTIVKKSKIIVLSDAQRLNVLLDTLNKTIEKAQSKIAATDVKRKNALKSLAVIAVILNIIIAVGTSYTAYRLYVATNPSQNSSTPN